MIYVKSFSYLVALKVYFLCHNTVRHLNKALTFTVYATDINAAKLDFFLIILEAIAVSVEQKTITLLKNWRKLNINYFN